MAPTPRTNALWKHFTLKEGKNHPAKVAFVNLTFTFNYFTLKEDKIFLIKLDSLSLLTISTFNHFTLKEGAINLLKLHSSISPPLSKTFL